MKQAKTSLLIGLFFIGLLRMLSAQTVRPDYLELFGSWSEEGPALAWRAEYRPAQWPDTLHLALRHARVDSVFWREGRRKQALNFLIDSTGHLRTSIPAAADPRAKLEIFYRLDWPAIEAAAFLEYRSGLYRLEFPINGQSGGYFFPLRLGSQVLNGRFHLSLPSSWIYQGDFEADFLVEHPAGLAYYFEQQWQFPATFSLELGRQSDFAARELASREKTSADSLSPVAYQAKKASTMVPEPPQTKSPKLPLRETPAQAAPALLAGFFFYPEELPLASRDREAFAREQALALRLHDDDTAAARRAHWHYYVQKEGEEWAQALLARRYRLEEWSDPLFWEEYLARYLKQTAPGRSLSDTALGESLREWHGAALSTAAWLYRERRPLPLALRYRYHGPSRSLELLATDSFSPRKALAIPLRVFWQASDSLHHLDTTFLWEEGATLRVPTQGSPRNAYVSLPPFSAVALSEERPENYYLYELVKSPEEERQQAALEYLLETENPKLLATVIGLVLSGDETELQIRALEKTPQLKREGLLRLQASLERVASQASREELRLLAGLALQRLGD